MMISFVSKNKSLFAGITGPWNKPLPRTWGDWCRYRFTADKFKD
jgi:hypothetical protein